MIIKLKVAGLLTAAILVAVIDSAGAGVLEYNTLTSFNAAAGATTTINFDSLSPIAIHTYFGDPGSVSLGGDTFSSSQALFAFKPAIYYSSSFLSAQTQANPPFNSLTIQTAGVNAIGFTYGDFFVALPNLTVTINGGTPVSLTPATSSGTFVGFTDTSLITSIVLTETGSLPARDGAVLDLINVLQTQQTVSATPLPAGLPLFATGLGVIGLLGRRRKRKNAAALAAA